jgi:hypothetical protein
MSACYKTYIPALHTILSDEGDHLRLTVLLLGPIDNLELSCGRKGWPASRSVAFLFGDFGSVKQVG